MKNLLFLMMAILLINVSMAAELGEDQALDKEECSYKGIIDTRDFSGKVVTKGQESQKEEESSAIAE